MNNYNAAFFGLYENWFNLLKSEFGEFKALALFRKAMETGLRKAYGNDFIKGKISEFARLVGERDENVGLSVKFLSLSEKKFIYQFHTDPFPNLKNSIEAKKLDDTYISFKIEYLLGEDWSYETTKHMWFGDQFTEFVITKN